MNIKRKIWKTLLAVPLLSTCLSAQAVPMVTDLALSLVVDVSGSVDPNEYNLQMQGYANALRDAGIQSNILGGANGNIFANVVFFDSNYYSTALDAFVLLDSAAAINSFADALDNAVRPGSGGTAIYTGVNRANDLMTAALGNVFSTNNLVIDVSGDGTSSTSLTAAARDSAAAAGITVNGLAIGGSSITAFYDTYVRTNDGFVEAAANFDDFNRAVRVKLDIETGGGTDIPLPSTLLLMGLGLTLLATRKKAAWSR